MPKQPYKRHYTLPEESFFLFGPRGVGKSTWLRQSFHENQILSLLDQKLFLELAREPHNIQKLVNEKVQNDWICIDEIQKLPALLNEVHLLMETRKIKFALSGSSASKLKKEGTNLLAGRALTLHMEQFSTHELQARYPLESLLEFGGLPLVITRQNTKKQTLLAYVNTYLKEEIIQEGLIRKLEPFARFLKIAGIFNSQILNFENLSREAKIPRSTAENYFTILLDSWLGYLVPAYTPGLKVRETESPKFYFFDPGVARACAGLLYEDFNSISRGYAFETWLFHELRTYNEISEKNRGIYHYRTNDDEEIDFVIQISTKTNQKPAEVVLIEVKCSDGYDSKWARAIRNFGDNFKVKVLKKFIIYVGNNKFKTEDGIEVLPFHDFVKLLFRGEIF